MVVSASSKIVWRKISKSLPENPNPLSLHKKNVSEKFWVQENINRVPHRTTWLQNHQVLTC